MSVTFVHNVVLYRIQHRQYTHVRRWIKKEKLILCQFILTCFISGDGELVAGLTLADQVLGEHADVVGGGGVQVDDGGLVELR